MPIYSIIFVWTMSGSFSITPFFGWSEYVPEQCGLSCAPCFQDPKYKDYSIYVLTAGFLIPTLVVIFSSILTVYRLNQYSKLQEALKKKKIYKEIISSSERRATFMILIMVFFFFGAWAGYSFICLLRIFEVDYPDVSVAIAMMTAKSSAWINTVIYIGMNYQVNISSLKIESKSIKGFFSLRPTG